MTSSGGGSRVTPEISGTRSPTNWLRPPFRGPRFQSMTRGRSTSSPRWRTRARRRPGHGAWCFVLRTTKKGLSDRVAGASANRMHIMSAIAGLEQLKRPVRVHLYTVSDYLQNGATSWVPGWRDRGWTTREGKPVSHRDLWQRLDTLCK